MVCFQSTLETYKFVLDSLLLSRFPDKYAPKNININDVFKFEFIIQWKLFVSAEWSSLLYFFGDFTAIKCLKLYHISSLIHPISLTTIQIFCFVENHKKCKKEKKQKKKIKLKMALFGGKTCLINWNSYLAMHIHQNFTFKLQYDSYGNYFLSKN